MLKLILTPGQLSPLQTSGWYSPRSRLTRFAMLRAAWVLGRGDALLPNWRNSDPMRFYLHSRTMLERKQKSLAKRKVIKFENKSTAGIAKATCGVAEFLPLRQNPSCKTTKTKSPTNNHSFVFKKKTNINIFSGCLKPFGCETVAATLLPVMANPVRFPSLKMCKRRNKLEK